MPRVNIYLPDDLADEVKAADINVSQVAQDALHSELERRRTKQWVERVRARRSPSRVSHRDVIDALHAVRDEMGSRGA